jgi:SAM-dependent methyltransferase
MLALMSTPFDQARSFWDREVAAPTHVNWMENGRVREYINGLVGGAQPLWPFDWFEEKTGHRRFHRALSIGCGSGVLERDLIRRGLVEHVDAFDGSLSSLLEAQRLSVEAGYQDRISYFAHDFNEPVLPAKRYEFICVHQALHHVGKLEKLYRAVLKTLTPGGIFYFDEYVGPSRTTWSDDVIRPHREVYARIPRELRTSDELPLPIQMDDPSEALRSDEILPLLETGFTIVERADYGGTLLAPVYPAIRWDAAPDSLVEDLIAAEKKMLAAGVPTYHAIVIARPRRGLSRMIAVTKYFAVPKLRALRVKVLRRLGRTVKY